MFGYFFRVMAVCVLVSQSAMAQAGAKGQQPKPILQLNSGGHMALIGDVVFTPDGNYLVSAADDKLIRVWDWRTKKTVRTIRGQVGAGLEGKIYAMALSPDGRYLAVGGWMGKSSNYKLENIGTIRLYDFASGTLLALLKGHNNVVLSLAFSPDCNNKRRGGRNDRQGNTQCKLISGSYRCHLCNWFCAAECRASRRQHCLAL